MNKLPKIYIIIPNEESPNFKAKLKIKKVEKRLKEKGFLLKLISMFLSWELCCL